MPTPKNGGSPITTFRSFFFFIILFAFLSFFFLFFNFSASRYSPPLARGDIPLKIVLWDVKESSNNNNNNNNKYSTFLGEEFSKNKVVHRQCPFNCTFTTDRSNLHLADAIIFEPSALDYDNWRRIPINMPQKQPYQLWIMNSFQHYLDYPLVNQSTYLSFMDLKMTYQQDSDIPLSLFCPFVENFKGPDDLLKVKHNYKRKKGIMFLSSNCQFSGAYARTAYVEELMKHVSIDSYGACLHNAEWEDGGKAVPSFNKMEEKLDLMRQYKIVLAFENNNVTDYVTEKLFNVFQAGALPIYMGAPNIDTFLPGKESIVKTSEFTSPENLAVYLKKLLEEEDEYNSYFAWKKKSLSADFLKKYERCMFSSECRVCRIVAEKQTADMAALKYTLNRPSQLYQAVRFSGQGDHVRVPHHTRLCVSDRYTLMAWVKAASFGDQRILDKNHAGKISGFNFDIQKGTHMQGFPRLCAGEGCYMAKRGILKDVWNHIAVVYSSEHSSVFQNHVDFYINGVLDSSEIVFAPTKKDTLMALSIGANDKDPGSTSFHGSLDNVGIFSTDMSAQEIRNYMFRVPLADEPNLVAFYSFDDPSDEQYAHDTSSYEYDGYIEGGVREPSVEKPLHLNKCH